MDRRILPVPGLPHGDRHLLHRTLTSEDRQAGPMKARKDFRPTAKILASLRQERGLVSRIGMDESKLENLFLATFFLSIILTKIGGNTNVKTLNGVNTKTPNGEITTGKINNGEITSGEKSEGYRLFAKTDVAVTLQDSFAFVDVSRQFRLQAMAISLLTGGDRTPRTHNFSQSCKCSALDSTLHTYMRACGSRQTRDMIGTCCIPARLLYSHPISQHVSQTALRPA